MTSTQVERWNTAPLTDNRVWKTDAFGINAGAKTRHRSFRMLRYWFIERLLHQHAQRLGRAADVLEIGVDRGQMKRFVDGAEACRDGVTPYRTWDAADCHPRRADLADAGYGECLEVNIDRTEDLADLVARHRGRYDVIILLHVLEHLHHPERAVALLATLLRPGGVVLGGFPVLPAGIAALREWQLRKQAKPFGHVSAFSPGRVRDMAEMADLKVDCLSGAFAVRASGSPLEDHDWWLTANLAFGRRFPGWPGELYWQLSRPERVTAHVKVPVEVAHMAAAD